jgi:predicted transcriptional regulator
MSYPQAQKKPRNDTLFTLRAKYYVLRGAKYYVCGAKYYVCGAKYYDMTDCTPRSRCRNARECDHCAGVRQSQIADIAERIEEEHGALTLTVIKPAENTMAAVKALHASFMRRALAPAGLWTVETGEQFRRLHLNILSPKPLPAKWRHCQSYEQLVCTTARDAAAYIAKRAGMPDELQYRGRLYGSWGQVGVILATQEQYPVVQAATLEIVLGGGERIESRANAPPARSKEDFAEIMRRHLPVVRALTGRAMSET